jgi:hypothetical protein
MYIEPTSSLEHIKNSSSQSLPVGGVLISALIVARASSASYDVAAPEPDRLNPTRPPALDLLAANATSKDRTGEGHSRIVPSPCKKALTARLKQFALHRVDPDFPGVAVPAASENGSHFGKHFGGSPPLFPSYIPQFQFQTREHAHWQAQSSKKRDLL